MGRDDSDGFTLAELAEESGVPPRTIRFYIARNLLDGPVTAGRGAVYTLQHRKRLEQIRALQGKGLTLAEIARKLGGERAASPLPAPEAWWHYEVAADVRVSVRGDVSPWRMRQVRAALEQLAQHLREENSHD